MGRFDRDAIRCAQRPCVGGRFDWDAIRCPQRPRVGGRFDASASSAQAGTPSGALSDRASRLVAKKPLDDGMATSLTFWLNQMVSQDTSGTADSGTSRGAILESATEVFMESGFSGARVDEIARRAKANKAMIYYHFGSKLELYRAVLLRLFGDVLLEIERLRATEAPPREKLRGVYTRIAGHFGATRALPHIMLREILAGGKSMDAEASRAIFVIVSFVSETLQEGMRTGEFRQVHPLLLHMSILAPLMVHFAGSSFRERILAREMPGAAVPSDDAMLAHLLESLDRSLAPSTSTVTS